MFLKIRPVLRIFKRNIIALYKPGDKSRENVAVFVPHMDFVKSLADRKQLELNVSRRKLTDLNVESIYAQWELYKNSKTKKKIEQNFISNFLTIPNDLHADTPDEVKEIFKFQEAPNNERTSDIHLKYEQFIDYYDESSFYLKNEAAIFDLRFPFHCIDRFKKENFIQFSNPDFAKTMLIEGAGVSMDDLFLADQQENAICTNLTHLVGNGSMLSFLGFITKLSVALPHLPYRWICTGKQYQPSQPNYLGLFDTCQSTAVQMFSVGLEQQVELVYQETLSEIISLYKDLDLHFRIVYVPAHELQMAECSRIRIEMYSPHLKRYIEVGNLSRYSDFVSKRLLLNYSEEKKTKFPYIISGTVCNVTKLIAIILENNNGSFKLPKILEHILFIHD